MFSFSLRSKASLFTLALLCAATPGLAASGGVDTPLGQADLPLMVQGDALINLHNDGAGNVYSTFNNTAFFNGVTVFNAMIYVNGGINFHSALTVDEGWSPDQALSINSNHIWKSSIAGDPTLYIQNNPPGSAGGGRTQIGNGLETWYAMPGYVGYGGSPQIFVNGDNHTGGGISISDDGGFFDYNDGFVTYNGSSGLRIAGNNGPNSTGGAQLIVNGPITAGQAAASDGCSPNGAIAHDASGAALNCINGKWAWNSAAQYTMGGFCALSNNSCGSALPPAVCNTTSTTTHASWLDGGTSTVVSHSCGCPSTYTMVLLSNSTSTTPVYSCNQGATSCQGGQTTTYAAYSCYKN